MKPFRLPAAVTAFILLFTPVALQGTPEEPPVSLLHLPPEILIHIISFAPEKRSTLREVCSHLRHVIDSNTPVVFAFSPERISQFNDYNTHHPDRFVGTRTLVLNPGKKACRELGLDHLCGRIDVKGLLQQLFARFPNLATLHLSLRYCHLFDAVSFLSDFLSGLPCPEGLLTLNLSQNLLNSPTLPPPFTNLQVLDLSHNSITDLHFLTTLTRLQTLDIHETCVTDPSPMAALNRLKTLYISKNYNLSTPPVPPLENLEELYFRHSNSIFSDFEFFQPLTNLQLLDLSGSMNFRKLPSLPNLHALSLAKSIIHDFSTLTVLTNLQILDLSGAYGILDAAVLSRLTSLHTLYIPVCSVMTSYDQLQFQALQNEMPPDPEGLPPGPLSKLRNLTNLRHLELERTKPMDFHFLAGLTNLQSLGLGNTDITDFSPLESLSRLEHLDLSHAKNIPDLTLLAHLTCLRALVLNNVSCPDFTLITRLTRLEELHLGHAENIPDLTLLAPLTCLRFLDLSYVVSADLTPVTRLTRLEELYLGWTKITDLHFLVPLVHLQKLDLSYTPVTDLSTLTSLGRLKQVWIQGCHQVGKDITPVLQKKGVKVIKHYEDPTESEDYCHRPCRLKQNP